MLRLVCYLFVISTSVIDCLGRFIPDMTHVEWDVKPCSTQLNIKFLPTILQAAYYVYKSHTDSTL